MIEAALKPRDKSRVQKIIHRGIDQIEDAGRKLREGEIDEEQFHRTWRLWDTLGTMAMSLISKKEQEEVVRSRQRINL